MLHLKTLEFLRKKLELFAKKSSILASKLNAMVVAHQLTIKNVKKQAWSTS